MLVLGIIVLSILFAVLSAFWIGTVFLATCDWDGDNQDYLYVFFGSLIYIALSYYAIHWIIILGKLL